MQVLVLVSDTRFSVSVNFKNKKVNKGWTNKLNLIRFNFNKTTNENSKHEN